MQLRSTEDGPEATRLSSTPLMAGRCDAPDPSSDALWLWTTGRTHATFARTINTISYDLAAGDVNGDGPAGDVLCADNGVGHDCLVSAGQTAISLATMGTAGSMRSAGEGRRFAGPALRFGARGVEAMGAYTNLTITAANEDWATKYDWGGSVC